MTDDGSALALVRRRYAHAMTGALPQGAARVRAAFAAVPREDFLGPPPWTVLHNGAIARETSDPADLYVDALVPLDATRGINNGSPSLHALMLHRLDVQPGDRVLHVGAGTGYYSALLAELTGPRGHVDAVEIEPALAQAARRNLAPWPWVRVEQGDGATFPVQPTQRIYVNFAAAVPADAWMDQLPTGGRLVLPLGVPNPDAGPAEEGHSARGAVLVVTRTEGGFAGGFDVPVAFICARGPTAGDPNTRAALFAAFGRGGLAEVESLLRGPGPPERCWFSSPSYSLCFDPP
jgi:protein-L-isoaspartate(D-aspartate) O-methyltransferase